MTGTSNSDTDSYAERLAELRRRFISRLPAQLVSIRGYALRLSAGDLSSELLKPLKIDLHSMAGSAGAFGEPALGAKAKSLELRILELERGEINDAGPISRDLLDF